MKNNCLLIDFDDTIVDFHDAEAYAFHELTKTYNLNKDYKELKKFMYVNQTHWEAFQQNRLTKEEVLNKRFEAYFGLHHINVNGQEEHVIFRDDLARAPIKYF